MRREVKILMERQNLEGVIPVGDLTKDVVLLVNLADSSISVQIVAEQIMGKQVVKGKIKTTKAPKTSETVFIYNLYFRISELGHINDCHTSECCGT